MPAPYYSRFIFSRRYRFWRHAAFWVIYTVITAVVFTAYGSGIWNIEREILLGFTWLPLRLLYVYPFIYWVLPKFLLRGHYVFFGLIVLFWFVAGWYLNFLFRAFVSIPLQDALHFQNIVRSRWMPGSFLLLTTVTGLASICVLFKHWFLKEQEWLKAEKEKVTAELQLLKAQIHPHFLFNTLNNIYSFSLENSPKTPGLILKLSSLLSYMLYDCKGDHVRLDKEIEIMKNYADLEQERYGNKLEISWNVEGDIKDREIAPLLILPFLENAFKHGTSEQLETPWLSCDLSVNKNWLKCKIANSKNEWVLNNQNGIGVDNVKKRLMHFYPGKHELKMNDEGNFFVVSFFLDLGAERIPVRNEFA